MAPMISQTSSVATGGRAAYCAAAGMANPTAARAGTMQPLLLRYRSERRGMNGVTVAVSGDSVVPRAADSAGVRYSISRIFCDHGPAEQYFRVDADADPGAVAADFVTVGRHGNSASCGSRHNAVAGVVVCDAVGNSHGGGAGRSCGQINCHPDPIIGSNNVIDCASCRC